MEIIIFWFVFAVFAAITVALLLEIHHYQTEIHLLHRLLQIERTEREEEEGRR